MKFLLIHTIIMKFLLILQIIMFFSKYLKLNIDLPIYIIHGNHDYPCNYDG